MKTIKIYAILLFVLIGLSNCEPIVYDSFGTLSGSVVEMTTGDVITGALVTLSPTGKSTYTGADGFFEFQDLDAQQYTITVQATGYRADRKIVTIFTGVTERVIFTLKKQ